MSFRKLIYSNIVANILAWGEIWPTETRLEVIVD